MTSGIKSTNTSLNFSNTSASNRPVMVRSRYGSHSMSAGDGRRDPRMSVSSFGVPNAPHSFAQQNNMVFMRGADDKETMKGLNNRLDKYLSRVRTLEESNRELEERIKEELLRRGTEGLRDWSVYDKPLADLRRQIRDLTTENARLLLQIDNARLAADDFKVKYESELALRQGVEQDIAGLRKIIDDTNMNRLQLEGEIEAGGEELAFLKKNHEEDLAELRGQMNNGDVSIELNAPKGPDMNETISKIRDDYEKTAQRNREDMDAWYKSKFDKLTAVVSENTEALQDGKSELSSLRREKQSLEVDLQALHNLNDTLADTLEDTKDRYAQQMCQLNNLLRQLELQLTDLRAQAEVDANNYQNLLNVKSKLEDEIATYHQLLEVENQGHGGSVEFSLDQALQAVPPTQKNKVVIKSLEMVDGQVVSQREMEMPPPNGTPEDEEEGTQSPPEQEVTSD
ncbi:hypothetical protein GJAV_G00208820 [Gymnothorax javanicus]|nr:hypothetical protein GJAV_G00208820 [Gymnothorax javanicus]